MSGFGIGIDITITLISITKKRPVRGKKADVRHVKPFWCRWPGCFMPNIVECFYPDNDTDKADELLCPDHAPKAGFCWGCGNFWAGVESFDFNPRGLCDNCKDNPDVTGEWDDERDDDEDDYTNYRHWDGYPDDYDPAGGDLPF